jgi:hypothetical protein
MGIRVYQENEPDGWVGVERVGGEIALILGEHQKKESSDPDDFVVWTGLTSADAHRVAKALLDEASRAETGTGSNDDSY